MNSLSALASRPLRFFLLLLTLLFALPYAQAEWRQHQAPRAEQHEAPSHHKKTKKGKRQRSVAAIGFFIFLGVLGFLFSLIAPIVFLAGGLLAWAIIGVSALGLLLLSIIFGVVLGIGEVGGGLGAVIGVLALIVAIGVVGLLFGTFFLIVGLVTGSLIYTIAGGIMLFFLLLFFIFASFS